MIRRQDQAGGVHLTSTLLRRKTTASIPKSVSRLFNKNISHKVFDIDNDDDSEDLVILSEEISKSNKGKEIEAIHQVVEVSDNNLYESGAEKFRTVSATKTSKDYPLVSNDIINIDCHGSDLSYGDGNASKDLVIIGEEVSESNQGKQIEAPHQAVPSIEYFGQTSGIESSKDSPLVYLSYDDGDDSDDLMILGEEVNKSNKGKAIETIHQEVSDYTFSQPAVKRLESAAKDVIDIDDDDDDDLILIGEDVSKSNTGKAIEAVPEVVARLDNIDVPSRIEVPSTFFRESDNGLRRNTFESSTCNDTHSAATNFNSHQPATSTNFESATKATSFCSSYSMNQAHMDNTNIQSRTEVPFTFFRESDEVLRSTFESNTWYDTQSAATNFNTYTPPTSTNFESATNYNTYKQPSSTNFESATNASSVYNSYSMNQARFDNINMPSRTETPFTSSRDSGIGLSRSTFDSSNWCGTQSEATNSHLKASSVNSKSAKKARLNNVDIATPNKRKSTAPTTSSNSRSAKKAHMDNFDISYEIESSFTWNSTFKSSTWYDTQSEATNSHYKASSRSRSSRLSLPSNSTSSRSSRLSLPANSKIQGSTTNSSRLTAAPQSVSRTKKAASSMRLLDAPKRSTATKISGKKEVGIGYKNSHATSSSNPSQSLDFGYSKIQESIIGALMGSSSYSQSVPYKKKADAPMRLLPAPKPSKKAAGSGSKKRQATSSSNPSTYMGSSLYSKSVSSNKKAYAPMRLLPASNPSTTSSYKPSRSLYSGVPSMKTQAAPSAGLRSVAAPSCPLLTYQWQVL